MKTDFDAGHPWKLKVCVRRSSVVLTLASKYEVGLPAIQSDLTRTVSPQGSKIIHDGKVVSTNSAECQPKCSLPLSIYQHFQQSNFVNFRCDTQHNEPYCHSEMWSQTNRLQHATTRSSQPPNLWKCRDSVTPFQIHSKHSAAGADLLFQTILFSPWSAPDAILFFFPSAPLPVPCPRTLTSSASTSVRRRAAVVFITTVYLSIYLSIFLFTL